MAEPKKLSARQQRFAQELAMTPDDVQGAYVRAGYKPHPGRCYTLAKLGEIRRESERLIAESNARLGIDPEAALDRRRKFLSDVIEEAAASDQVPTIREAIQSSDVLNKMDSVYVTKTETTLKVMYDDWTQEQLDAKAAEIMKKTPDLKIVGSE